MLANPEIWRQLGARPIQYGRLRARELEESPVVLALDHEGLRHILVPVESEEDGFTDSKSRGLSVSTRVLEIEDAPARPFLDICCTAPGHVEAFDALVVTLLDELGKLSPTPDAVRATLARWRRFWGVGVTEGLSEMEVRGLFGELWFLLVWLLPHGDGELDRWTGPEGARHDFQWENAAVEVKTTSALRGHIHRINGLDQLDPPGGGPLSLFSLRVRAEPSAENSLVSLIASVTAALGADRLNLFEERLGQVGYSPAHNDRYQDLRFRIVDERLYRVAENFPRLSEESFTHGLPTGVERVEYEINLDGFDGLVSARAPENFVPPDSRGTK